MDEDVKDVKDKEMQKCKCKAYNGKVVMQHVGVHKACDSQSWKLHGKVDKRKEGMSIFIMYYMTTKTKK